MTASIFVIMSSSPVLRPSRCRRVRMPQQLAASLYADASPIIFLFFLLGEIQSLCLVLLRILAMNTIQDRLTLTFTAATRKSKLFIAPIRSCYEQALEKGKSSDNLRSRSRDQSPCQADAPTVFHRLPIKEGANKMCAPAAIR